MTRYPAFALGRLACLGLLGLAACATGEPAGTARLGPDPAVGGGVFSSGGGLVAAAELREIGGRLGVCGVWAKSPQSVLTLGKNGDVLETGSVQIDGRTALRNLGFLREVPFDDGVALAGREGRCAVTAEPWQPAFAAAPVRIRFPRQIVVNDRDGMVPSGGGIVVTFRQTPVFDGAL